MAEKVHWARSPKVEKGPPRLPESQAGLHAGLVCQLLLGDLKAQPAQGGEGLQLGADGGAGHPMHTQHVSL